MKLKDEAALQVDQCDPDFNGIDWVDRRGNSNPVRAKATTFSTGERSFALGDHPMAAMDPAEIALGASYATHLRTCSPMQTVSFL
jgi:hypothetical protein